MSNFVEDVQIIPSVHIHKIPAEKITVWKIKGAMRAGS